MRTTSVAVPTQGSSPVGARSSPLLRAFATGMLVLLAGYLLLNRGFAWFHVPKTPLFVGEIVLGLGVAWAVTARHGRERIVSRSAPLALLAIFMTWGAILAVPRIPAYGVDAVRDSAIWYYGGFAFLVVLLFSSTPGLVGRWFDRYERFLPVLLTWLPVAFLLQTVVLEVAPTVPDSKVSLLSHSPGTMSLHAAAAVAFVWVARSDHSARRPIAHVYVTTVGLAMILLAATQSRSGLVSTALGLTLAVALKPKRRGKMLVAAAGTVALIVVLGAIFVTNAPVSGKNRALSPDQIRLNLVSIVEPEASNRQLASTAAWRLEYWQLVVDDVLADMPLGGYGFGVNIREIYGFQQEDPPSRNTHNSHVNVLARMGTPGLAMWLLTWGTWFLVMLGTRARLIRRGRPDEAGLFSWLVVATAMPLVNAYFTSTLEAPQVAVWLWTLFGIGAFLAYRARAPRAADLAGEVAPQPA